jgi:hypothetical protein
MWAILNRGSHRHRARASHHRPPRHRTRTAEYQIGANRSGRHWPKRPAPGCREPPLGADCRFERRVAPLFDYLSLGGPTTTVGTRKRLGGQDVFVHSSSVETAGTPSFNSLNVGGFGKSRTDRCRFNCLRFRSVDIRYRARFSVVYWNLWSSTTLLL